MDCDLKERMEGCDWDGGDLRNKQTLQCDVVEEQGGMKECE